MWWMREEKRMVKETNAESEAEIIEASGDAIVISQGLYAIAESLGDVAAAIRKLAAVQQDDDFGESEIVDNYLDGSRI